MKLQENNPKKKKQNEQETFSDHKIKLKQSRGQGYQRQNYIVAEARWRTEKKKRLTVLGIRNFMRL